MMKVLCNLTTKKIETFKRWGEINFNPETHIVLTVSEMPDIELYRLNDANDGIRPHTQAELDAIDDEQYTKDAQDAIQKAMDEHAKSWMYDDAKSASDYANITNPNNIPRVEQFKQEGILMSNWRAECWDYAIGLLEEWQAGGAQPTIDEIVAGMPAKPVKPL